MPDLFSKLPRHTLKRHRVKQFMSIFKNCLLAFVVATMFAATTNAQAQVLARSKVVGTLSDERVTESSGIAASRRFAGFLWTHNDSGDAARVFLLNARGQTAMVVNLSGAGAIDPEDMAIAGSGDKAQVYVGDIGDNSSRRDAITILRFSESQIARGALSSTRSDAQAPQISVTPQKTTLRYPDGAHDAETLMATPDGSLIIVTKALGVSTVFKTPRPFAANSTQTLVQIGQFRFGAEGFPTRLTSGGDLSADGKRVVIRTYSAAYEWTLPRGANAWRDVWKTKPRIWSLPPQQQGEAICYAPDGRSWFLSSEGNRAPLLQAWPGE